MRVLVTRRMTPAVEAALTARYDAEIRDSTAALTEAEASAALAGFDAIIPTLGDRFTAAAFAGPMRARIVANFGAGVNHIDLDAAKAAGVVVTNTPDVVTDATADIAMMLVLMAARRASEGEALLRAGRWTGWQPTQMLGMHVSGRTLGIVGMGRIGKAIARRAHHGFGMRIVFHNRSTVSSLDLPARQMPGLHELLAECDIAILTVPGGAGTRHMIDAAALAALGPRGILVNVARGDVVDEAALIAALETGGIAGAGLDVYENEPEVPESLRALPNVTLLPHLGTATEATRTAMGLRALANLSALLDGRAPADRVA